MTRTILTGTATDAAGTNGFSSALQRLGALGRRGRGGLWFALAVVAVPLCLLLFLQYRWLAALEHSSTIAHLATLNKQLDLVTKEISFSFTKSGERTLQAPPWLFTQECDCFEKHLADHAPPAGPPPRDAAEHERWLNLPGQGARTLFLSAFSGPRAGQVLAYDVAGRRPLGEMDLPASVRLVVYYWQMRAHKAPAGINTKDVLADETDRANPMLLMLAADATGQVVGVTGMVLDTDFFAREVLPLVLRRFAAAEPGAGAPPGPTNGTAITVWNGKHEQVWSTPGPVRARYEAKRKLGFVLTDWYIALGSRGSSAAELARTHFYMNVSLATLLAAVLVAGIVLAVRTADRAMRLSQMKSDFVSNVSHELRTPLSSIRVFGELMRLGRVQDPAKVREYGEYIECEGRRLSRLIDNILDFSRIEAGRKVYHPLEQDLADVARDVLCTLDVRLRREGFAVELKVPPEPLPPALIDPGAIGHALSNLVDNAAKYSGESRRIVVSLEASAREVSVSVRDFGIGIPAEEHARIFDRFHRVGSSLVPDVKGAGLGLAIVKHIVDAHHGRVTLSSTPAEGSVFTIHLPVASVAAEAAAPEAAAGVGRS